jgi:hypothetical protein
MKPLADYLETRNALLLTLRDHDEELRVFRKEPGEDRARIVEMLSEMGVECWTFREGPWLKK